MGYVDQFSEIILTGGEPMVAVPLIYKTIEDIRGVTDDTPIYLYTANLKEPYIAILILGMIEGMTVTLHDQVDVKYFRRFTALLEEYKDTKSLRLNIFKGVDITSVDTTGWVIKDDIVWLDPCPVPEDEVFMRL